MAKVRQVVVALGIVTSMAVASKSVRAQTSTIDQYGTCHYVIPSGSTIYAYSGEVWLNNRYIGNYVTDCNTTPSIASTPLAGPTPLCSSPDVDVKPLTACVDAGGACVSDAGCCATPFHEMCQKNKKTGDAGTCCHDNVGGFCHLYGADGGNNNACCWNWDCRWAPPYYCVNDVGWAEKVTADAVPKTGLLQGFNGISTTWQVPSSPSHPGNVNTFLFWNGLQTDNNAYFQPELWYWGDSQAWSITSQFNGGTTPVGVEPTNVNVGDVIMGYVWLEIDQYHSGDGNQWFVGAQDLNDPDKNAWYAVWTYADLPTQAVLGLLEVQGLTGCGGLPPHGDELFNTTGLTQAGAGDGGLTQYENVLPYVSPSGSAVDAGSPTECPPCDYSTQVGDYYDAGIVGVLVWNPAGGLCP
jgi:hypothetical protein